MKRNLTDDDVRDCRDSSLTCKAGAPKRVQLELCWHTFIACFVERIFPRLRQSKLCDGTWVLFGDRY